MKVTQLEPRLQGAIRPGVLLTLTDDDGAIDSTVYTWTMKGAPSNTRVTAWTKSAGFVASAGGLLSITWAVGDLGACIVPTGKESAVWVLDLDGASGSGSRKYRLTIEISAIQTP